MRHFYNIRKETMIFQSSSVPSKISQKQENFVGLSAYLTESVEQMILNYSSIPLNTCPIANDFKNR